MIGVVVAPVLAMVALRSLFMEPFSIPSGNMLPTLRIGDYLLVSKSAYGYSRYSFPFGLGFVRGRIFKAEPKRGDIAVFKLPSDNETDYIKRLIGLPGDTIQMRAGRLYINAKIVPRRKIGDFRERGRAVAQYIETLPNGRAHRILEYSDRGPLDNTREFKVPQAHYFALGDNRDNALDSRVPNRPGAGGVGFVPLENLIGPLRVIVWNAQERNLMWKSPNKDNLRR